MNENLENKINSMLEGKPKDIKVIEFGIDFNVVKSYLKLMASLPSPLDESEIVEQSKNINELSETEQQKLLAQLAQQGSVPAYRTIEAFMESAEGEMKKWGIVALQHCRMQVENDLLDEPVGFIATGLGGKGSKIRYYMVLKSNEALRTVMVEEVEYQYKKIMADYDSELEEVEQLEDYILIKMLCPFKTQPAELVEEGLPLVPFLSNKFVVTNMMKPTLEKIEVWMKKKNRKSDEDEIIFN